MFEGVFFFKIDQLILTACQPVLDYLMPRG